jgi:P2 family phage contractile tail tube protein
MGIPRVLKNFGVFADGRGYLGKAAEVTLPKLTRKMEELRAGGMNAPVEIDMGMEKLECDATFKEYDEELFKLWGVRNHAAVNLRFKGALEADDAGNTVTPVEAVVRGRLREIDPGGWKPGDEALMKIAIACSYYRYTSNGAVLIEIDVVNMIERVNGVDRLAAMRRAIGG